MDYEGLRSALAARPDASTEQVTVNQRHLIDKILARYSAEHTVFREVLQNANDATATSFHIDYALHPDKSNKVRSVTMSNNGRPFTESDWQRLKSIAEGNPDETKIGFFGVGFYSLFSMSEEPMVVSEGQYLAFYWQRDQLFTRQARLSTEKVDEWTVVYLKMRDDNESLPNWDELAQFIAKSLLFTEHLRAVSVSVNGQLQFKVEKRTSPDVADGSFSYLLNAKTAPHGIFKFQEMRMNTLQLLLDKRYQSESPPQRSASFMADLWKSAKEILSGGGSQQELERLRAPGQFSLFARQWTAVFTSSLPGRIAGDIGRVTKKRPPQKMGVSCLYSSFSELSASDDRSEGRRKHPVLSGVLPRPISSENKTPTGHLFVAFPTHQSSGVAVHCCGPFIPTVERESLDFVDPAVRVWNEETVGAVGIVLRGVWEGEADLLDGLFNRSSDEYHLQADHLIRSFPFSTTSPLHFISRILSHHFIHSNQKAPWRVPTSRGMRPVEELRSIPREMRIFLVNTPQLLIDLPDFNTLLSSVHGVKSADYSDLLVEAKARTFTHEQLGAALKWAIRAELSDSILMELKRTLVVNGKKLSEFTYYMANRRAPDWPLPPDCLPPETSLSVSLSDSEWRAIGQSPLRLSDWTGFLLASKSFDAVMAEDILVHLEGSSLDQEDLKRSLALLSSTPSMPSTKGLMLPNSVYLEDVGGFGVGVPLVQLRRRRLISDQLLKLLGVRSHLPPAELLPILSQSESQADIQVILKYLSSIQEDLTDGEIESLRLAAFLPASNGKYKADQLYRDSPAARILKLPVLKVAADDSVEQLLHKLGFNFYIPLHALIKGIIDNEDSRHALYGYLIDNFSNAGYSSKSIQKEAFVEVDCGADSRSFLGSPEECYSDPRCRLLHLPTVRNEQIARALERLLDIQPRPSGLIVVNALKNKSFVPQHALLVFSFCADCPFTDAELGDLSSVPFIPILGDQKDVRFCAPKESFFRVPEDFTFAFVQIPLAIVPPGSRSAVFLRAAGVGEEPAVGDLMQGMTVDPIGLLKRLDVKRYAALLRLFAVHLDSIDMSIVQRFANSPVLLAIQTGGDESREAQLLPASQVFLPDDPLSQRLFHIPTAPADDDDLAGLYERLGCRRISSLVGIEYNVTGPLKTDSQFVNDCRILITERAELIAREGFANRLTKEEQHGAVERLLKLTVLEAVDINVTRSFPGHPSVQLKTTVCVQQNRLIISKGSNSLPDPYDLAGCLSTVIFATSSSSLSDRLLLSTLISTPISLLRERGFIRSSGRKEKDVYEGITVVSPEKAEMGRAPENNDPPVHPPPVKGKGPHHTGPADQEHHKTKHRHKPDIFDRILSVFGMGSTTVRRPARLSDQLADGINATRPNRGTPIPNDRHVPRPRPPLEQMDGVHSDECAIAHDLVSVGRLDDFEYYQPTGRSCTSDDVESGRLLASHLATLSSIFNLDRRSLHIFTDPDSRSIAFNRGGALFFNSHYLANGHGGLSFWYMTMCHELAHNFAAGHDQQHEHYLAAYAEHYLDRLIPRL